MSGLELIDRADACGLCVSDVRRLAGDLGGQQADDLVDRCLDEGRIHAATILALAAVVRGCALRADTARRLLPELESLTAFAAIGTTCESPVRVVTELICDGVLTNEHEALGVYLASQILGDAEPPPSLVSALRRTARHDGDFNERMLIGQAAAAVGKPEVTELLAKEWRLDTLDEALRAQWILIPRTLAWLPEHAPPVLASGVTFQRSGAKLGANDPCHCGSGKKYKACHRRADEASRVVKARKLVFEPGVARRMSLPQFSQLYVGEMARLDPADLTAEQREHGFLRLIGHRRWDASERYVDAIANDDADKAAWLRGYIVGQAFQAGRVDLARRHIPHCRPDVIEGLKLQLALADDDPQAAALVEERARVGLAGQPDALEDLAHALLTQRPALGILVARGSLDAARSFEREALLDRIEEARDRLGLPPNEPYRELLGTDDEAPSHRDGDAAELSQLRAQMAELRARSQRSADELAAREATIRELQRERADLQRQPAPEAPAPQTQASTKQIEALQQREAKLRARVDELKGTIRDGNEQRRDLRERLDRAAEQERQRAASQPKSDDDAGDDEEGLAYEASSQPLRIPSFTELAHKHLLAIPANVARDAIARAAALAGGDAGKWSYVKQSRRVPDILMARIGIHYRMLFQTTPTTLSVHAITHRKELERTLERMLK